MYKRALYLIILDIIILSASFLFWIVLKPATLRIYLPTYLKPFLVSLIIWVGSSIISDKYIITSRKRLIAINKNIVFGNFLALAFVAILIYTTRVDFFSRQVLFGTVCTATIIELIIIDLYYYFAHAKNYTLEKEEPLALKDLKIQMHTSPVDEKTYDTHIAYTDAIKNYISQECSVDVFNFIQENIDPFYPKTLILSTATRFNIDKQPDEYYENFVNLKRINDIRFINKFFESVNAKLPFGGVFIGCAETKDLRKNRILGKYPVIINYIYYFFDFIIKRVFPKFKITKGLYFFLTRGQNRVLSRPEILGRLYSCGFELVREEYFQNHYFFIVHKIKKPYFDAEPTYGPFIKLRRIGKNGKMIKVYKFRTMHPYAEYIQELVYDRHNLDEGGKLKNDFRVNTIGKILRKFWLDELPMLFNLIKGDIKIVGVRPLSRHYYSLYTKELQERRIKYKPGLIPPFYVDLPKTIEEIMQSEIRYLDAFDKHPFLTDFKYFFKAIFNIIFRHARSN